MVDDRSEELLVEWVRRFQDLAATVHRLHMTSEVVEDLDDEIVRRGSDGSGFVVEQILRPMYAAAQSVAVRTLVDDRRGSESLVRLLLDMEKHPELLSRERYLSRALESREEWRVNQASKDFDRLAGEGLSHVPRRVLRDLRTSVVAAGGDVKRYVDEHVAHKALRGGAKLTWGQLTQAIHELSELYTTIGIFVTGDHHVAKPSIQFGWHQVFEPGLYSSDGEIDLLLEGLYEVRAKRPDDYSLELQVEELVRILGGDIDEPLFRRRKSPDV